MKAQLDALRRLFKEGRRAEAIAGCEALCEGNPQSFEARRLCSLMHVMTRDFARALDHLRACEAAAPEDADVLFNIGMCERELGRFADAARTFRRFAEKHPAQPDGWASLADCRFHTGDFQGAAEAAQRALRLDPRCVPALAAAARSEQALGRHEDAVTGFTQALKLEPGVAELMAARAESLEALGRHAEAAKDYTEALARSPGDEPTLKKATMCLLQLDRGPEAIELCRKALAASPDSVTARLGAEWLLSQMVPLWHVPMMNEDARNRPYLEALQAVVAEDQLVLEIGTGSGLLAMMAAKAGAKQVVTCEAVRLVAETAKGIVEANGLAGRVTVLAKPSYMLDVGKDLPRQADILVHEIFSSELLGEHVLPALEDAKARLLKPGGRILPGKASLMIALVGGEALGTELHVEQAFGFDLRGFNAINPRKRPIHREDLPRVLLGDPVEAFRFDFEAQATFPPEKKRIELRATQAGRCWGVIQWIRFEFLPGIFFENSPVAPRPVASWQHTVYRFDVPADLAEGDVVPVRAMHDRSRPWFERFTE
jgi:tetratricopeptide (TPR) repeat protein